VSDCRKEGIKCQIIPGIMPILSYDRFIRMVEFCKTKVPPQILEGLEPTKHDDEAGRQFGIEFGI